MALTRAHKGMIADGLQLVNAATILNNNALGKIIYCTGTTADYTVTLPDPTESGNYGKRLEIVIAIGMTKLVTLAVPAGNIDGVSTRIMWAGERAQLICDGTKWSKLGGRSLPMIAVLALSSTQSISTINTATLATVTAQSDSNCPAAMTVTTNRATALRPGNYDTFLNVRANTNASATSFVGSLYKNGSSLLTSAGYCAASGEVSVNHNKNIKLAAGDYLQLYANSIASAIALAAGSTSLVVKEVPTW